MHDLLALLAVAAQPFTIAEAAICGVERHAVARLTRGGALHRVDRGAYVLDTVWRDATAEQRHLLRCRAVLRRYGTVALSHTSAVVVHGLPVHAVDLDEVHLTRTAPGRTGRVARDPAVQVHPPLPAEAFTVAQQMPTCIAPAAILQVADWHGTEAGMVAAEAGLHRRRFTTTELRDARGLVRLGRGSPHAAFVMEVAGANSESPGETLTRLLLRALGHAAVQQQVEVRLPGGGLARVDFLLADLKVVVEFDGAVKYEGAQGRDALMREKRREDGLRTAGYEVVRLTWSDLRRPQHVRALLLAARERASARTDVDGTLR